MIPTPQDKQAVAAMRYPNTLTRWLSGGKWHGFGFVGIHFQGQGLTLEFRRLGLWVRVKLYSKAKRNPQQLNQALNEAQQIMARHGKELQRRRELGLQLAQGKTVVAKAHPERVATPEPVRRADEQFWPKSNGHRRDESPKE